MIGLGSAMFLTLFLLNKKLMKEHNSSLQVCSFSPSQDCSEPGSSWRESGEDYEWLL